MFGVYEGKPRTKLGSWINRNKISQEFLIKKVPLNKNSVSKLCNDPSYEPREDTQLKIVSCLRKHGYNVSVSDFW